MPILTAADRRRRREEAEQVSALKADRVAEQNSSVLAEKAASDLGNNPTATSTTAATASESAAKNAGWAAAIGQAGAGYGQAVDPEGSGVGSPIAGAASGAATGTMIAPGWGTAIGAVAGLGLGLMQASNKRKQIQSAANQKAGEISAQGLQNAANVGKPSFSFGSGRGSFSQGRNLKF